MTTALVPVHVLAGGISIVAGLIALYAAKGAALHRRSGLAFAGAMLVMSLSGAVMAIGRPSASTNVPAGLVTAYLVITAFATVRTPSAAVRRVDRAAMVAAFVFGAGSIVLGLAGAGRRSNAQIVPLLAFGAIAVLAGLGDLRMVRAGGLRGAPRLKRHLWRMCAALFVAAGSFFLGPSRRIPEPLRIPALRLIPLIVLVTMAFWLWRLRRKRTRQGVVGVPVREAI